MGFRNIRTPSSHEAGRALPNPGTERLKLLQKHNGRYTYLMSRGWADRPLPEDCLEVASAIAAAVSGLRRLAQYMDA
jgi:hypothetical protein